MNTKTGRTILAAALFISFAGAAMAAGATLETAVGKVIVKLSAETPQRDANAGMALPVGAVVATGATGRAVIRFNATDTVRLAGSTQLKIARHDTAPGSSSITLLKLLVGSVRARLTRPAASKSLNFGLQAGQAVCAVKGTDFEATGQKGADPVFTCNTGLLVVGRVAADGNLENAFSNLATKGGRSVGAGFMVTAPAAGLMPKAVPAPVLKSLEIVSGKVTVVEDGKKVEKGPGEVIEPGTKCSVGEGGVLLAGSKMAVEGAEGSNFTLSSKPDSKGAVSVVVTVGANSQMVTVDTGAELVPIDPGTSLQVKASPGEEAPVVTQVRNPTAAEIAASAPKPIVVAAAPKTEAELDTKTGEVTPVATAPKPAAPKVKVPAAPAPADTEEPSYSFGQLAFFSEPSLPPPPPDTTNQDIVVVSPIAPQ